MESTQNLNWSDPNLYLFLIGYSIMFIPLYKRELLIQKKSFTIIIIVSVIMFITALLADLLVDFIFFNKEFSGLLSFYFPPYIVLLYRFMRFEFKKITKREPIDTSADFGNVTPMADKIFNILYFTLVATVPVLLISLRAVFTTSG